MNKLCTAITYIAAFAFFLALCSIETLAPKVFITLFVSGVWLAGASAYTEAKRRSKTGRYYE